MVCYNLALYGHRVTYEKICLSKADYVHLSCLKNKKVIFYIQSVKQKHLSIFLIEYHESGVGGCTLTFYTDHTASTCKLSVKQEYTDTVFKNRYIPKRLLCQASVSGE